MHKTRNFLKEIYLHDHRHIAIAFETPRTSPIMPQTSIFNMKISPFVFTGSKIVALNQLNKIEILNFEMLKLTSKVRYC